MQADTRGFYRCQLLSCVCTNRCIYLQRVKPSTARVAAGVSGTVSLFLAQCGMMQRVNVAVGTTGLFFFSFSLDSCLQQSLQPRSAAHLPLWGGISTESVFGR